MKRAEKQAVVEELNKTLTENNSILLIDFTGLNVPEATELRRKVSQTGSQYRVIKNRLALRAIEQTPLETIKEHFRGPTAIACTNEDPVALTKALKEFIAEHPSMTFKVGLVDGRSLSSEQVDELAEMPSRNELLSKLVFLLNAPLVKLATALQSPVRDLGSVLKQLGEKEDETQQ